jgi:hypothetical protein
MRGLAHRGRVSGAVDAGASGTDDVQHDPGEAAALRNAIRSRPRYDFQGISDDGEMQAIVDRLPEYARVTACSQAA